MIPRLQPPRWALAAGLPKPETGEDYYTYWERVGVPADVVARSIMGLTDKVLDIANERMSSYLASVCPLTFDRYVSDRLGAYTYRRGEGADHRA